MSETMSMAERAPQRIVITEQDLARIVEELEALEGLAQAIRQDIAILTTSINELKAARNLVKMLADGQKLEDSYAAIGGGIFLKVKVDTAEKILVRVGSQYVVEMSPNSALDFIDKRIKELEDVKSRLELRLAETLRRVEYLRQLLAVIYSSAAEAKRAEAKGEAKA